MMNKYVMRPLHFLAITRQHAKAIVLFVLIYCLKDASSEDAYTERISEVLEEAPDFPSLLVPTAFPSKTLPYTNLVISTSQSDQSEQYPSDFPSLSRPTLPAAFNADSLLNRVRSRTSHAPSDARHLVKPSMTPSETPLGFPITGRSVMPSAIPSITRSVISSATPSTLPPTPPSGLPSPLPSVLPTTTPTKSPSAEPTLSMAPSSSPSNLPSEFPSTFPSQAPSQSPSEPPTALPSSQPSEAPSSSPTLTCHDVASYENPAFKGKGNGCENINPTTAECIKWRLLGLNPDQVEELIESCPVSCRVDCGLLNRFQINITFIIANVPNFFSPETVRILDETSVDYLTKYVQDEKIGSDNNYFLYQAELLSQQIVQRIVYIRSKEKEDAFVDLNVTFAYRGMAINISDDTIQPWLEDGIYSEKFTKELQESGDPALENAQVHEVHSYNDSYNTEQKETAGGSMSKGAITATILGVSIFLATFGVCFYHNLNGRYKGIQIKEAASPLSPAESVRSPLGSVFSFDSIGMVASLARMVSSPRGSESDTIEGSSSSQEGPESDSQDEETPLPSGQSAESDESEEEIHPFTGLIPPMIIVDNIDGEEATQSREENEEGGNNHGTKNVVPSRHVEASSEFVAALNDHTKPFDPTEYSGLLNSPLDAMSRIAFQDSNYLSMFRVFSSEEDEDVSASSTPLMSSVADEKEGQLSSPEHRRTLSDSAAKEQPIDLMAVPPMMDIVPPPPPPEIISPPPPGIRQGSVKSRRILHSGSSPSLRSDSAGRLSSFSVSPNSDRGKTSPEFGIIKKSPDVGMLRKCFVPDGQEEATKDTATPKFLASLFARSPAKTPRKSCSDISTPVAVQTIPSPGGQFTDHSRQNSRSSFSSTQERESNEEVGKQFVFHAPRKGKLGLVIGINSNCPTVMQVKDYSPLLGQVLPLDRILSIDGVKTTRMSLPEVTNLLNKPTTRRSSPIKIVLLRLPNPSEENERKQLLNDNLLAYSFVKERTL